MLARAPGGRWIGGLRLLVAAGCCALAAGCATGTVAEEPAPTPPGLPSAAPTASASLAPRVPAGGVSLATLGFSYGPVQAFSVPRAATITDRVDQPNAVTVVFGSPSPEAVAEYYRWALPATGFAIVEDSGGTTLTFTGQGWRGALTGSDTTSAVTLRPG